MIKLVALTDYKGKFGSKHFDSPYRSGMDKEKLKKNFLESGIEVDYIPFHDIDLSGDFYGKNIIYTSSEDIGYHYKSYIEDIIYALELSGAHVIPNFRWLKANNNKVFMELLRKLMIPDSGLKSYLFGTLKELQSRMQEISFPCVLKESEGASGTGVFLIKNQDELVGNVKRIARTRYIKEDIKDCLRSLKHDGYRKESLYRRKFMVQDLIPDLKNDWKIYVFGEKVYPFFRPILKGRDIRASGGGYDNYFYGKAARLPEGILDYSFEIFNKLDTPHVSMDIAFDGKEFHLIEFQCLYFGTAGIVYSRGYFKKSGSGWTFIDEKLDIEKVYADSIYAYLKNG